MKNLKNHVSFGKSLIVAWVSLHGLSQSASAVTTTWTGSTSTTWDTTTAGNWDAGVPTATGTAIFTGTPTTNQPTVTGTVGVLELVFGTTAGGWTLGSADSNALLNLTTASNGTGIDATMQTSGVTVINSKIKTANNQNWLMGAGGTLVLNGSLTGSKIYLGSSTATGTYILNAANTNLFYLNGGTIVVGNASAFGDGTRLAGATLTTNGTYTLTNTFQLTAPSYIKTDGANTLTLSGVISGNTTLHKTGNGLVTLTGANTYTGQTCIDEGTLSVASINSIVVAGGTTALNATSSLGAPTSNSTIAIGSGATSGTLAYTGAGETTNRVISLSGSTGGAGIDASGSGALVFSSAFTVSWTDAKTLTLTGANTGDNTLQKAIGTGNPTVSLTKSGVGKWVLFGANTYTGATTVSAGELDVNGSLSASSAVSVNGGLLKGTGTVGNVAVSGTIGGTLTTGVLSGSGLVSPGNSPGILTAASLASGNSLAFAFELATTTPTYTNSTASGNDVLHVTNSSSGLNISSANAIHIYFSSLSNTGALGGTYEGTFYVENLSGTSLLAAFNSANVTYYIVDNDGTTTGDPLFSGTSYTTLRSDLVNVSYSDKPLSDFGTGTAASTLNFVVVPEPSTWAMLVGGLGMLAFGQRMRRRISL